MSPGRLLALGALGAALFAGAPEAGAQQDSIAGFDPPVAGGWEPIESLGQPLRWKPFFRAGYGLDRTGAGEATGPSVSVGVFRDFYNPIYGALGLSLQGYIGQRGEDFDGGVQAHLESPATFLHAGADWNVRMRRVDPAFGLSFPLRRGGWPVRGSQFRVDWIPGRAQSLVFGFTFPLGQPLEGRTRSRTVDVELPDPPGVEFTAPPPPGSPAGDAVADLRESMRWLTGLHSFFWLTNFSSLGYEDTLAETREALSSFRNRLAARDSLQPGRDTYQREVEFYHGSLDRAFGGALDAPDGRAVEVGRPVADRARAITLEEVVLPYNRTVGRYKQPDVLDGLAARARARFIAWLELEDGLSDGRRSRVLSVLDAWLADFEQLRRRMTRLKRDSRTHWLPLALVLRPEEHDSQDEIDALLETALDRSFSGGNTVEQIDALRFQDELRRTIHEAERYHVLWIHDYRGRNAVGAPDRVGFSQTTEGYLRALLERVRAYDERGRLPVYLLLLDQHFYEDNDGRLWLDLLEEPLTREVRLPPGSVEMERTIRALQDSLRRAVADSRRLQAEAEALGPDWIESVLKVHVNVTNPSDFTFRSRRLLRRGPPIGADNMMRDHRKIVIRDLTETDPARGEVILAGVGVGEHYASPTWDDPALILRGPAALEAKERAREVLERHQLGGRALPAPLRPRPRADDYPEKVRALEERGASARVLQVHNQTGWGEKRATFLQMLLYDLAPPGTVLYVPDSLWTSYEWMAQIVSAALRGCRVYVVAPALDHAPSAGFPQMSAMQELITRLVLVREEFGDVIRDAGGELRVGLYSRKASLDDLPGMLADVDTTFAANPFLRDLFPFSEEALSVLRERRGRSTPDAGEPRRGADAVERLPKMHRKTQLVASASLLRALASAPEMSGFLEETFGLEGERPSPSPLRLVETYERLEEEGAVDEPVLYFMSGSVNKNARSMALDGEAMAAVAGPWALVAYLDFVLLSGGASWVRSIEEVEALLPHYSALQRLIGRWLYRIL